MWPSGNAQGRNSRKHRFPVRWNRGDPCRETSLLRWRAVKTVPWGGVFALPIFISVLRLCGWGEQPGIRVTVLGGSSVRRGVSKNKCAAPVKGAQRPVSTWPFLQLPPGCSQQRPTFLTVPAFPSLPLPLPSDEGRQVLVITPPGSTVG